MTRTGLATPVLLLFLVVTALAGGAIGFVLGRTGGDSTVHAATASLDRKVERRATETTMPASLVRPDGEARTGRAVQAVRTLPAAQVDPEDLARSIASMSRTVEVESPTGDGVIEGRVATEAGDPLGGVDLVLVPSSKGRGTSRSSSSGAFDDAAPSLDEALERAAEEWAKKSGRSLRTRTGSDGRFRLDGVPDERYILRAEKEGWRFRVLGPSVVAPGDSIEVEAAQAYTVQLALTASDGTPIEEAVLYIDGERKDEWVDWSADEPNLVVADPLVGVRAYSEFIDVAGTNSRSPARLISDELPLDAVAATGSTVSIELHARCIVVGRLLGNPRTSTGGSVFALALRPGENLDPTMKLNDPVTRYTREGGFVFDNLMPGRHAIGVVGRSQYPVNFRIVDLVDGVNEVEIERERVDPTNCIVVRSLAPSGRRLENVDYSVEYMKPGQDPDNAWVRTYENVDGVDLLDLDGFDEFDYDSWPSGTRMWLLGRSSVYGSCRVELTAGQRDAELRFETPCELVVTIADFSPDAGCNITIHDVSLGQDDPPRIAMARSAARGSNVRIDRTGTARFVGLAPGPIVVKLGHASRWWGNGAELDSQELTLSGKEHRIELQSVPLSDLSVVITPVQDDESFYLRRKNEDGEWDYLGWGSTTDDGRLRFRSLPPGAYRVALGENGAHLDVTLPTSEVTWDISDHVTKLIVTISNADGMIAQWGLVAGDRIVSVDGEPVEDREQLLARLNLDDVTVTVERGEETLEIEIPRYPKETRAENKLGGWINLDSGD
ncbi:MAG: hypothetical protein AAF726_18070 [Planctomycetota bacterium]